MAQKKTQRRVVKVWNKEEERLFKQLVREGTPTTKIAKQLKRSTASVRSKAQKFGLSLGGKKTRRSK
jgi:transposase